MMFTFFCLLTYYSIINLDSLLMDILDLFSISFGEIDIPPVMFYLIIFLTVFIFLAVLISTTKLIQSFISDSE